MKKKIVKAMIVLLSVIAVIWIAFVVFLAASADKINYYLDEYDIDNATAADVVKVNLHLCRCVKIGETEKSDIVLSRTFLFEPEIMFGYKYTDRLGSTRVYKDKNGSTFSVTATDDWCPYFRVYSITKGII